MDDHEAIRQLTAGYGRAGDDGDLDTWLRCFTPGGVFRRVDTGAHWSGEAELRRLFEDYPVSGRHVTTDLMIDVDGSSARQTCYLQFFDRAASFRLHMFGVYRDELIKTDGEWRFVERNLTAEVLPPPGAPPT
jgi:hypothetical protein